MSEPKKFKLAEPESDDVGEGSDVFTDDEGDTLVGENVEEPSVTLCGRKFSSLSVLIIAGVLFAAIVTLGLLISIALGLNDKMKANIYVRGAVASDSHVCSEIGYAVLKQGGTAVDSAIATLVCLGVVRMHSAGMGGGGVMLIRNASGEVTSIDYRESSPGAATQNMFTTNATQARIGGLAVAVPGQLKGLTLAHQLHGKLPWKSLIQPSVAVAKNGFHLEQPAYDWATRKRDDIMRQNPQLYALLFPNGTPLKVGSTVKLPKLAATLQAIADSGSGDVFYNGSNITRSVVDAVTSAGGILTLEDMARYQAAQRPALSAKIRVHRVYSTPAPTSGATLLSMLSILSGYGSLDASVTSFHRMIEAMKFAFVRRAEIADPDTEASVASAVAKMISEEETERLRQLINDTHTQPLSYYGATASTTSSPGTVQVSVERGEQEAVSVTESIGSPFGSLVSTADGIILNNAMNDFSIPGRTNSHGFAAAEVNYIKPYKRPLSSMSPAIAVNIAKNDTIALRTVIGAGGGPSIPSTVLQVMINMLDKKQTVSNAIQSKRLYQRLSPTLVAVEAGFPADIIHGLSELGHNVVQSNYSIGHCSAVYQNDASPRFVTAASDRRNSGIASYGALSKVKA